MSIKNIGNVKKIKLLKTKDIANRDNIVGFKCPALSWVAQQGPQRHNLGLFNMERAPITSLEHT